MIKVAICDDDEVFCIQIEDYLKQYSAKYSYEISLETFYSGDELYSFLKKENNFDIIFLDIEMRGLNGIGVGKYIRYEKEDNITQIVYISSRQDYAMSLFQNRPFDFLIKPVYKQKIFDCISRIININKSNKIFYEFNVGKHICKVLISDIIYIESNNRKIRIVTQNSTFEAYDKISDIMKKYKGTDLVQIHKSYVINYTYATDINYVSVKLSNNTCLDISRSFRNQVREFLMNRRMK